MKATMTVDDTDAITIVKYKTARHKQEGYHGPIFISLKRLAEIHMPAAEIIAQAAINKAKETP